MTIETMTIHKALSELKVLDKRISDEICGTTFCTTNKHINKKINGRTIEETKADMKAAYNKITDLIKRRTAIKKAVTLSNAVTKVTVNGKEMTVAEAIELNKSGMSLQKELKDQIASQYSSALFKISRNNGDTLNEMADRQVAAVYGGKDSKIDANDVSVMREEYIKNNTLDLIQGFDIAKTLGELSDEIDNFKSEVDSTLSTSNALTEITIEY